MKRKDFIKSIGLVSGAFLIPKKLAGEAKNPLFPGLRGTGFHTKDGMVFGFARDEDGFTEEIFVEYYRIPTNKDTKYKRLHGGSVDPLAKRLSRYSRFKRKEGDMQYDEVPTGKIKFVQKRLAHWLSNLGRDFERQARKKK